MKEPNKIEMDDFVEINQILSELDKIKEEDYEIKIDNCLLKEDKTFLKYLEEYLEYPDFLNNFVNSKMPEWIKNAYIALYHMVNNRDYCIFKNEDIVPFSFISGKKSIPSVYSGGLYQILEIKHKLRIKDEFLPIMFFSNASFFLKYKINDEFLFFGLTGTIEYPEMLNISLNIFFNSKILFMPQYKKKRFMELPLKLSDFGKYLDDICEDIINNFHKGRKILVICCCLKEAEKIKNKLEIFGIGIENIKIKYSNHFKDSIILQTINDNKELYNKKVKIILSINLDEIKADIKSSKEEEKNGGLI